MFESLIPFFFVFESTRESEVKKSLSYHSPSFGFLILKKGSKEKRKWRKEGEWVTRREGEEDGKF